VADFDFIVPVRDAIIQHQKGYSNMGSDYSVTDLIAPPRIVQFRKRYKALVPLALPSDQLSSFIGTAIHNHFEKCLWQYASKLGDASKYLIEKRLWDKFLDRKVSGKFDVYHDGTLYDFKCTTVWKMIYGDSKDWENQLNLYTLLITMENLPVHSAKIIAIFPDWQQLAAYTNKAYPREKILEIDIPIWPNEQQYEYLMDRLTALIECEKSPDDQLPECTVKEMWEKDTVYAVHYKDSKKASRCMDSEDLCQQWIEGTAKKKKEVATNWHIEVRPGRRVRCEDFCEYRGWCNQYRTYKTNQAS